CVSQQHGHVGGVDVVCVCADCAQCGVVERGEMPRACVHVEVQPQVPACAGDGAPPGGGGASERVAGLVDRHKDVALVRGGLLPFGRCSCPLAQLLLRVNQGGIGVAAGHGDGIHD